MQRTNSPLLRICRRPPITVPLSASVQGAVQKMVESRVGAVVVLDGDQLAGIFTERDLLVKVAGKGLRPEDVPVRRVMVKDPVSVGYATRRSQALELMLTHHFRHLPVVGPDGHVEGMLSIRHLLHHQVTRLKEQMDSLEQYIAADGPGG
ncbi:MAG: CBS domain-containing protein [Planctomycetota bacterium]|jgi:CBS domain-containing protein